MHLGLIGSFTVDEHAWTAEVPAVGPLVLGGEEALEVLVDEEELEDKDLLGESTLAKMAEQTDEG